MDDGNAQRLQTLEVKLDAVFASVEKTRRYFQITMWVTIFFLVAPLVLMAFVVPTFLNSYLGSIEADSPAFGSSNQSQLDQLKDLLQ